MVDSPQPGNNKPISRKTKNNASTSLTDVDLHRQRQELGTFGRLFGSKENAPIYFAGTIAIVSLFGVIAIGIFSAASPDKGDLVKILGSIVISALTFLGGVYGGSRR